MHDADLTPLDARNSMLFGSYGHDGKGQYQQTPVQDQFYYNETPATIPMQEMDQGFHARNVSEASHQGLMLSAAPISMIGGRNRPQSNYEDYPGQKNRHQERDSGPYEDYPGQFPPTNQIPASPRKQQQQEIGVARAY